MTTSQRLRQRPSTSRAGGGFQLLSSLTRSRLFDTLKPWLTVLLILAVLGLAGGVEMGTVWP